MSVSSVSSTIRIALPSHESPYPWWFLFDSVVPILMETFFKTRNRCQLGVNSRKYGTHLIRWYRKSPPVDPTVSYIYVLLMVLNSFWGWQTHGRKGEVKLRWLFPDLNHSGDNRKWVSNVKSPPFSFKWCRFFCNLNVKNQRIGNINRTWEILGYQRRRNKLSLSV